jgi:hypothetical protein
MLDVVSPVLAIWAPLTHLRVSDIPSHVIDFEMCPVLFKFDPHSTWVRYLVMFGRRLGLLEWVSEKRKVRCGEHDPFLSLRLA